MSYSEPWCDDFEDDGLAWTSNRIELRSTPVPLAIRRPERGVKVVRILFRRPADLRFYVGARGEDQDQP